MTVRETGRWRGVVAVAFLAAAVGIATNRPGVLLASVVGVAFAAYARPDDPPDVRLDVERTASDAEPAPGEPVTVTVRATNEGATLLDLRLIDGVPPGLDVIEGSPRRGTALRSGKTATLRYAVRAERGVHAFGPLTAIARDASGALEREVSVDVGATITCVPPLPEAPATVPLRGRTATSVGPVASNVAGGGSEFFATREYRPTDAITRVDWNRLARTGDLATIEYREERAATVVLVVDARRDAYVGSDPHAVERAVEAARHALASLLDDGHYVGVAAIAPAPPWLAPSAGPAHRDAARRLLATHPALAPTPPTERTSLSVARRDLRRRLPANAQVFLFSPLADDGIADLAARLEAYGYAPTVVSPDATDDDTAGRRLAGVERGIRIARLRRDRIPVVDWRPVESIERAFLQVVGR